MSDFRIENNVLVAYEGAGSVVTLPDTITKIGAGAFRGCHGVTKVILPKICEEIGADAFRGLPKLKSVQLGEGLKRICEGAFAECGAITALELPKLLEVIGEGAFADSGLTELHIPDAVNSIGAGIMRGCRSLATLTVHEANVHYYAKDGVLYTKKRATVLECSPGRTSTVLELDECTRVVGKQAFYGNTRLTEVIFPASRRSGSQSEAVPYEKGVTDIEAQAFAYCTALRKLTLPGSLRNVDTFAFRDCTALTELTLPPEEEYTIGAAAFLGCRALRTVTLPERMRGEDPARLFGKDFSASVTYVAPPKKEQDPLLSAVGRYQDANAALATIYGYSFSNSEPSTPAKPAKRTMKEKDGVLLDYGTDATAKFPETVRRIAAGAFGGCRLTSLDIPRTVREIDDGALSPLNLTRLTLPGIFARRIDALFGGDAIAHCEDIRYAVDTTGGFEVDHERYGETTLVGYTGKTHDVVLPEGIERLPLGVFTENHDIRELVLPASLRLIEEGALSYLSMLDDIIVAEGNPYFKVVDKNLYTMDGEVLIRVHPRLKGTLYVHATRVADGAACGVTEYHYLKLGKKVEEIGRYAFAGDTSMGNIMVDAKHGAKLEIEEGAFAGCNAVGSISCPGVLKELFKTAVPWAEVTTS